MKDFALALQGVKPKLRDIKNLGRTPASKLKPDLIWTRSLQNHNMMIQMQEENYGL